MESVNIPELAPSTPVSGSRNAVIGGLLLVLLLAALDSTIVATALPTIVGEFGGLSRLSWVVTAYLLAQTVVTPLYGKLGDLYGRKSVLQSAIILFLLGSVLCGASQSLTQLIIFRAIQGLGGGGLIVSTQAVIGDIVSARDRGRYQGLFGAVFGLASVAGPLLGGFFTSELSWRWIFFVNVPLGALAMVVIGAILPAIKTRTKHVIDYTGAALLALGLSGLVLALDLGGTVFSWTSVTIISMLLVSIAALIMFVRVEKVATEPILPPSLFSNRIFAICASVGLVVGFALFGSVTYMPLYLQVVQGSSPTRSGLELLPMMGGMFVTSIISGQIISRTGRYRYFPIAGTAVSMLGLFMLSRMDLGTSRLTVGIAMTVLGLGLGMVMQVLVLAAQNAVEYKDLGVATSGITLFRSVGGSLGTAVLGAIFADALERNLREAGGSAVAGGAHSVDLTALAQMAPAARATYLESFTGALGTLFLVAAFIAGVGFLLTWFLEERALRETVAASAGPAESFSMPTDDDSMRQLSHGLWVLLNRGAKKHMLQQVAARAKVLLTPAAVWLLMRIDRDALVPIEQLAVESSIDPARLNAARDELLVSGYIHPIPWSGGTLGDVVLTPEGRAALNSLFAARESFIAERLQGWEPNKSEELSALLHKLAHDIESEVPG